MSELSEAAIEILGSENAGNAGAFNEPPRKRRGRPPGSKNKPKDGSGNPPPQAAGFNPGFIYMKDANSVKASTALGMTVWFIASMMLPVRPLTEDEGIMLGEALDPVLCRWIPVFGEWKYEAGLLMVIMTLYFATAKNTEKETPPDDGTGTESTTQIVG